MPRAWLALDTAAPRACVAVIADGRARGSRFIDETRRHAEELAAAIDGALGEAGEGMRELEGVAVGAGPGSFVGVRVGIAYAKGLAAGLGVPLVGLCSLTALACEPALPDGVGLALLDARRGEVYLRRCARAAGEARAVSEPLVCSPARAADLARTAAFVVGNALELLGGGPGGVALSLPGPSAQGLAAALQARLAAGAVVDERGSLVPVYCRPPDARLPP